MCCDARTVGGLVDALDREIADSVAGAFARLFGVLVIHCLYEKSDELHDVIGGFAYALGEV